MNITPGGGLRSEAGPRGGACGKPLHALSASCERPGARTARCARPELEARGARGTPRLSLHVSLGGRTWDDARRDGGLEEERVEHVAQRALAHLSNSLLNDCTRVSSDKAACLRRCGDVWTALCRHASGRAAAVLCGAAQAAARWQCTAPAGPLRRGGPPRAAPHPHAAVQLEGGRVQEEGLLEAAEQRVQRHRRDALVHGHLRRAARQPALTSASLERRPQLK